MKDLTMFFYTSKDEKVPDIQQARQVWSPILYPFQVLKEVVKDQPDIVHIQHEFNMFGPFYTILFFPILLFLLKMTQTKTIVTIHAVVPLSLIDRQFIEDLGGVKMRIPSILIKMIFVLIYKPMFASALVVHDECFRSDLISSYKVNKEKVYVIPHGVEHSTIEVDKAAIGKWPKEFANKEVVLYFGYIAPRKGLEYLLDAYAQIADRYPNHVLVIAGKILPYHSSYLHQIVEQIGRLGLSRYIVITGYVTDEEIHILYELAKFIILPYTYSIASSGALAFSFQHQKPIIATNIGAFREELEDGKTALLCPPRNSETLEKALIKMMEDPSLREEFSRNLGEKIPERSWQNVGKKTYDLYEALLSDVKKH